MIYLRHPTHGTKVAISEAEAIFDESHGWVRYDPATGVTPAAPTNELVARRRGRPPLNKGHSDNGDDSGRSD